MKNLLGKYKKLSTYQKFILTGILLYVDASIADFAYKNNIHGLHYICLLFLILLVILFIFNMIKSLILECKKIIIRTKNNFIKYKNYIKGEK